MPYCSSQLKFNPDGIMELSSEKHATYLNKYPDLLIIIVLHILSTAMDFMHQYAVS